MPCKVTLFFNQYDRGFSETFFLTESDVGLASLNTPNAFYQAATNFRHTSVNLKAVRFTSIDGPRRSNLVRPYPTANGNLGGGPDPGADVTSTTAVFQLKSAGVARRLIWIRGLADGSVSRGNFGNDTPSANLRAGTNTYFAALVNLPGQIRFVVRPPDGGLSWRRVKLVSPLTPASPARTKFITEIENPVLVPGTVISFTGVPSDLPRWPRKAEILSVNLADVPTSYTIAYALPGGVAVSPKNLKFATFAGQLAAINSWGFVRFGEHKTGRPFGSLRGRSRTVASLR